MFASEVGYYCQLNNLQTTSAMQQASLSTTILPPVLCLVCNSRKPCPSVRSKSATICEACKKFFLRHRDIKVQQALQCATGRRDCDVTVTAKRPCSACRLAKCFNIGMRFEDYPMRTKASKRALSSNILSPSQQRQLKQQQLQAEGEAVIEEQEEEEEHYGKRSSPVTSNEDSSSPSPQTPGVSTTTGDTTSSTSQSSGGDQQPAGQQEYDEIFDLTTNAASAIPSSSSVLNVNSPSSTAVTRFIPIPATPTLANYAEEFLRKSLRALTELTAFEALPLRRPISQIPDENNFWRLKMEHFQAAARSATAYVRQLPAFTNIPLSDRPVLFANALYPLLIADLALPSHPRGLSFLGMSERNRAEFLRYFSEFQMLSEDTNRITEVFSQWCPTMFEFAILAALLFYEPCFPGLQSTEMVRQVNDQLKTVLRLYLPQHCTNPKLINWRLEQFEIAFGMLRRASIDHCLAIEMLARRRPALVSMNELFYEVFTHTQRAVALLAQQRQQGANAPQRVAIISEQKIVAIDQQTSLTQLQPVASSTAIQPAAPPPTPLYNSEPLPAYQPRETTSSNCFNTFETAFLSQAQLTELPNDPNAWNASSFNF